MPLSVRECIRELREYIPGKNIEEVVEKYGIPPEKVAKLASNENPIGPSPKAIEAIIRTAGSVHIYPEKGGWKLREAISEYLEVPPETIILGNGVDGVIEGLMKLFIEPGDNVIFPIPTFLGAELLAVASGGRTKYVMRDENFEISPDDIFEAVDERTKMIYLCTPNNPTGNVVEERVARELAEEIDALILLDEAYVEFADSSLLHLIEEYENVVIMRTFSKAFGLAGLRCGYAICSPEIRKEYDKVIPPFDVNRVAIEAAIAALKDKEFIKMVIELVREGREFLRKDVPFKTYPSQANFVFVDVSPFKSSFITEELMKRGIIIRDCSSFTGAKDTHIRITVGKMEDNLRVVEELKKLKESDGFN